MKAPTENGERFNFFRFRRPEEFSAPENFSQKHKKFSELRKVLLLFQKFFGFGKLCDYYWGFTIGVAVLACGSME